MVVIMGIARVYHIIDIGSIDSSSRMLPLLTKIKCVGNLPSREEDEFLMTDIFRYDRKPSIFTV